MSDYPYETKRTRTAQKAPSGKIRKHTDEMHHEIKGDITKEFYEIDKESIDNLGVVDMKKREALHRKKFRDEW